ncbi:hypothetical protein [Desulfobulbus propionicus]|jgi:hypothetical protein
MKGKIKYSCCNILLTTGFLVTSIGTPARALDCYGFGSYWDKGDADGTWGLGLGCSLPLLTDFLQLDGRVSFFENSELGRKNELTMMPVDLGLQLHPFPESDFDPYAVGGVSFVYADADRSDVDSRFGAYLGGGVVWDPLSFLRLFGEMTYRFQELDGEHGRQIDASGYTGNVGVRLSF